MANSEQDKFDIPDISGKWIYMKHVKTVDEDGKIKYSGIEGTADIKQDNLSFSIEYPELSIERTGIFKKENSIVIGESVNKEDDSKHYFFFNTDKDGKLNSMISTNNVESFPPKFIKIDDNVFVYRRQ